MIRNDKNRKTITYLTIGAILLVSCLIAIAIQDKKSASISVSQQTNLNDKFLQFENNIQISRSILSEAENISEKEITIQNNAEFDWPIENKSLSNPYSVYYKLIDENAHYTDITLTINTDKNIVSSSISGLKPNSPVSFLIDTDNVYKNVPSDWSGKITFINENANLKSGTKICLDFPFTSPDKISTICHHIIKKGDIT